MRKRKIASAVAYVLIFAIAIALFNGTTSFAAETIASGTCGANATWTLDSDGLLVISGTGETRAFQCDEGVWSSYKNKVKRVVIEDGITDICAGMFGDCVWLTSINISDSVTSIGYRAFSGCSSLTSITIPDSVTSIGNSAFSRCSRLITITILDGVTSIGPYAFSECVSLTSITIPDGVTSIGDSAFYECSSLTSITIPDSVTSIDDGAFQLCRSLTTIIIPDGVTKIGKNVFGGCRSLTTITIPDSVTSIGESAFDGCISLTKITIPDSVTSIGISAFSYCSSLTAITIPDSVTSIGPYAFSLCYSLTSITIPDSVTSIGYEAFSHCTIIVPYRESYAVEYALKNGCCVHIIEDDVIIGHIWSVPTYTWSEDNKTCTATRVCQNVASHVETETVNVASEVVTPSSCITPGTIKYTATFSNEAFDTQTKTINDISAEGHDWSAPTYTWSEDNKTCTATRVCKNDPSHKETETATVANKMVKANTLQKYVK